MNTTDANSTIVEGYLKLLESLSHVDKLQIISRLTSSLKPDLSDEKSSFKNSFGAFQSEATAEELINEIRESRNLTRKVEDF